MDPWIGVLIIVACLAAYAFFSASETALLRGHSSTPSARPAAPRRSRSATPLGLLCS
jgi:Mg2+/Co2+ transporter CorB